MSLSICHSVSPFPCLSVHVSIPVSPSKSVYFSSLILSHFLSNLQRTINVHSNYKYVSLLGTKVDCFHTLRTKTVSAVKSPILSLRPVSLKLNNFSYKIIDQKTESSSKFEIVGCELKEKNCKKKNKAFVISFSLDVKYTIQYLQANTVT